MTIRYRSGEDDARNAFFDSIDRQRQRSGAARMQWACIAAVTVLPLLLVRITEGPLIPLFEPEELVLMILAPALACWALRKIWPRFCLPLAFRRLLKQGHYNSMLGELEVELAPEGVREKFPNGSIVTEWPGVEVVESDETYLKIRLRNQQAHWIPWSAFVNADEADAFAAYARERVQTSAGLS
jgi:hypothetical protein